MNDLRTLRERQFGLAGVVDNAGSAPPDCAAAMLGTTTTVTTYPTVAGAFYSLFPTDCGGNEVEGGAATYVTSTSVVEAFNVGSQVPPSGTRVVAHGVGGRWVFRYDG